jgi:thiamine biosynthesis lipoprotein
VTVEQPALHVQRYVEHVMGMPISLALRGRHVDDPEARDAWQHALAILRDVDGVFSTYRDDSFVSRLNAGETTLEKCPPEVREVLDLGERARRESGGAFDVRRVAADGTLRLDTDGVVKGWAVQRAAAALTGLPDTDFCLSAGGDMVCHVADDTRPAWRIGIEDPHDPSAVTATVEVRRGAVATSGHAHRGQHIVDARTGRAPTDIASVTVLADDLTWADLDATAAYAMGPDALTWLRARPGRRGVVVWEDGRREVFGDAP